MSLDLDTPPSNTKTPPEAPQQLQQNILIVDLPTIFTIQSTMLQASGQSVFSVPLPNGRMANICTEEGALQFIAAEPKWVTTFLAAMRKCRENNEYYEEWQGLLLGEIPRVLNGKHADQLPLSEFKAIVKFYEGLYHDLGRRFDASRSGASCWYGGLVCLPHLCERNDVSRISSPRNQAGGNLVLS